MLEFSCHILPMQSTPFAGNFPYQSRKRDLTREGSPSVTFKSSALGESGIAEQHVSRIYSCLLRFVGSCSNLSTHVSKLENAPAISSMDEVSECAAAPVQFLIRKKSRLETTRRSWKRETVVHISLMDLGMSIVVVVIDTMGADIDQAVVKAREIPE